MSNRILIPISLLLLAALLSNSCGETNDSRETTSPVSSDSTPAVETPKGLLYTTSAEEAGKLGLDGYEFNVYIRSEGTWENPDLYSAEENGDNFNDAVYRRRIKLEDTFGFTIKQTYSANTYLNELGTLVLAGDDTFDCAFPMARQAATDAQKGVLCDLNTLNFINLDSDIWARTFNETLSFDGKQFFAAGDISTNSFDSIRTFMFNKELLAKYNLESPYELVRSGKWTLDKLNEMVAKVSLDINGDSKMTADDQWGMAWQSAINGNILFYGCDEHLTIKGQDDIPKLVIGNQRSYDVFQKIQKQISNSDLYFLGGDTEIKDIFKAGRSLFLTEVLYHVKTFRDMEIDFGVIPSPKYDESQESYMQYVDSWCPSPVVIPKTVKNLDRAAFFVQLLAETGREFIRDEYYEKSISSKSLRDEESVEMLDIIVNNYVLDNAVIYSWGGLSDAFKNSFTGSEGLASLLATYQSACEAAIDATAKAYSELE